MPGRTVQGGGSADFPAVYAFSANLKVINTDTNIWYPQSELSRELIAYASSAHIRSESAGLPTIPAGGGVLKVVRYHLTAHSPFSGYGVQVRLYNLTQASEIYLVSWDASATPETETTEDEGTPAAPLASASVNASDVILCQARCDAINAWCAVNFVCVFEPS